VEPHPGNSDVTILLKQWKSGDASALEQVTPLVYEELRRLAASYLRREREGHTLQPTALLNEAYMRLVAVEQDFSSRSHFFGVAAHLMRLILVDHARSKRRQKRGGGEAAVPLEESMAVAQSRPETLLALDEGLRQLAAFDERKAKVIEMRFFGGMNLEETAEALGISQATVGREQRMAEAWLNRYLSGKSGSLRRSSTASE